MRLKFTLFEGFRLLSSFLTPKRILSLFKVGGGNGDELLSLLRFMFGTRESYVGLILSNGRKVNHSLYALVSDGKVLELGSVSLENKLSSKASKELYSVLSKRGVVSKVISYSKERGEVSFHPN